MTAVAPADLVAAWACIGGSAPSTTTAALSFSVLVPGRRLGVCTGDRPGGMAHFDYVNPGEGPHNAKARLDKGSGVSIVTPGAGGYGPARERDTELVRRDLEDGKISMAAAVSSYGLENLKRALRARPRRVSFPNTKRLEEADSS